MKKHHVLFLVVGISNTAVDFFALNFFAAVVGLQTLIANAISVTIAMAYSYLANMFLVFESDKNPVKQIGRFLAISFVSAYLIQTTIIAIFTEFWLWPMGQLQRLVDRLDIDVTPEFVATNGAKTIAVAVAGLVSYYAYKNYVFKGIKKQQ